MRCPTCWETREKEFWRDRSRKNGFQVQCKACTRAKRARWLAKPGSREKVRLSWKNWYHRTNEEANP